MPLGIKYTKTLCNRVTLEDLEGNDERVREEVRVDGRVEDVDRTIVGCREEERVGGGERDGSERSRVVPKSLVGCSRKVEIVPD